MEPIFIGGTGRSGTTILSKFIGSHDEAVKIPLESRFIIDKNGLIDVFESLTNNYSMDQGRVALRAFKSKMQYELTNPYSAPYLGWNKKKCIPNEYLVKTTDKLISKLSKGAFKGADYQSTDSSKITHYFRRALYPINRVSGKVSQVLFQRKATLLSPSLSDFKPQEEILIPIYFENQEQLLNYFRDFVLEVFTPIFTTKDNTTIWCEDTPANILSIDFLKKLFPNGKFIHVMRHPVGVAFSMQKMVWAPKSLDQCCDLLEQLYKKLMHIHKEINTSENYLFIKLEDLASDSHIQYLTNFIDLDIKGYSGEIKINPERMNYYTKEMNENDISYVKDRLKEPIDFFGYK